MMVNQECSHIKYTHYIRMLGIFVIIAGVYLGSVDVASKAKNEGIEAKCTQLRRIAGLFDENLHAF